MISSRTVWKDKDEKKVGGEINEKGKPTCEQTTKIEGNQSLIMKLHHRAFDFNEIFNRNQN